MIKTILVGGGGHALSLLEILPDSRMIAGYADLRPSSIMRIPFLGTDDDILEKFSPDEYDVHVTLVYTLDVNLQLRKKIINRYNGFHKHTFLAQSAVVSHKSELSEGCLVMERTVVNHSIIGKNTVINTGAIIEHGCKIGDNCFVGPGVILCGGVTIGDNTLIGAGAVVRDGLSIAPDCTIGMGSLVVSNIILPGLYYGSPVIKR